MVEWVIEILPEAQREIDALPRDLQARFYRIGEFIIAQSPQQVGMPYVRHLEDKLWEMRMKGKTGIARAIYFTVVGKKIVVCSAFTKKTQKTPKRELQKARNRYKEYLK